MQEFPVIDISHFTRGSITPGDEIAKKDLARRVDGVCRETGFLAIMGHGVSAQIISGAWDAARTFFDLPLEKKLEVKMPYVGYPYGYSPLQAEALAKSLGDETPPDLKESLSIGPLHAAPRDENDPNADFRYAQNLWPKEPREFRQAWTAYYEALGDLAGRIMRIFALALDLPEGFFEAMIDDPISAMRALSYPHPSEKPRPGQLRAGAHSDYGSLTILLAEAAPGGLEIRTPAGEWESVPIEPGAFVVNIGDLMARWTNDRWVSTLHRVVNPPREKALGSRRLSTAFFHQPNYDAVIECLPTCCSPERPARYGRTTSGEHVWMKINKHRAPELAKAG